MALHQSWGKAGPDKNLTGPKMSTIFPFYYFPSTTFCFCFWLSASAIFGLSELQLPQADRSYWRQSGIRLALTKNKHCGNSNSVGLSGSSRARMPHQDEMRMRPILKNTQIVHFLYWSVKYVGLAAKFTVKGRLKCKDNKIFPEHNFRNVRIQNISTTLRSYSLASRLYRYSSSHNFHLLNQLEYIFKKKQLIAKLQVLKERQLGIFLFCWNW